MKSPLPALVVLVAGLALGPVAVEARPVVGEAAPDFQLTDATGKVHRLADYRGRVVVLEWTNPTCPFVQRHYGEDTMEQLEAAYPDSLVAWLAVNSTHYNSVEQTREWSQVQGVVYPTLLDPDGTVGRLYEARTTPQMFVVDAAGILRYDGAIDDDPDGSQAPAARTSYVKLSLDAVLAGQTPAYGTTRPYGCSVKYASR